MRHLLHGKKNIVRKNFYRDIFENYLSFEFTAKIWEGFNALGISKGEWSEKNTGSLLSGLVTPIQILMLDQSKETQEIIIKASTEKVMTLLKNIFESMHGADDSEEQKLYWEFILETVKETLVTDYNEKVLKKYMDDLYLYDCLRLKRHPVFYRNIFKSIEALATALSLGNEPKRIALQVLDECSERVEEVYSAITVNVMPYKIALGAMGAACAALVSGMPYFAAIIGVTDIVMLSLYAVRPYVNPVFKKEVREHFIKIGKQSCYKELGFKLTAEGFNNPDKLAIAEGIRSIRNALLTGRYLTKKTIAAQKPGEEAREIYVPANPIIEPIPVITDTQRKKIKGKRTVVSEEAVVLMSTARIKREITLPEECKATLIECENDSLLLIEPPSPRSGVTIAEMEKMMGPRGTNVASKYGQSGIKMLTRGNGFWVKDKNSDVRITLKRVADVTVQVDGKQQSVPVLKPERMNHKNKLRLA
jgi:hypothetical protein